MDSKEKKDSKKVVSSDFNKDELIFLFKKMHSDFNMLDSKMKEILNSNNLNTEDLKNIVKKFNEANKELNEYAEQRNKIIIELLKTIKN
jgi:hypothetical protein